MDSYQKLNTALFLFMNSMSKIQSFINLDTIINIVLIDWPFIIISICLLILLERLHTVPVPLILATLITL